MSERRFDELVQYMDRLVKLEEQGTFQCTREIQECIKEVREELRLGDGGRKLIANRIVKPEDVVEIKYINSDGSRDVVISGEDHRFAEICVSNHERAYKE